MNSFSFEYLFSNPCSVYYIHRTWHRICSIQIWTNSFPKMRYKICWWVRISTESQFRLKQFGLLMLEVSGSTLRLLFLPFCNTVSFPLPPSSDNNHHTHTFISFSNSSVENGDRLFLIWISKLKLRSLTTCSQYAVGISFPQSKTACDGLWVKKLS